MTSTTWHFRSMLCQSTFGNNIKFFIQFKMLSCLCRRNCVFICVCNYFSQVMFGLFWLGWVRLGFPWLDPAWFFLRVIWLFVEGWIDSFRRLSVENEQRIWRSCSYSVRSSLLSMWWVQSSLRAYGQPMLLLSRFTVFAKVIIPCRSKNETLELRAPSFLLRISLFLLVRSYLSTVLFLSDTDWNDQAHTFRQTLRRQSNHVSYTSIWGFFV